MKTLCLNMIVKNESSVIRETLENLVQKLDLDYWVISDTGSTDNTPQMILDFFQEKNIPGELFHDPWKDFGHNRTLALEHAYQKSDYLLIFDADDKVEGTIPPDKSQWVMDMYRVPLRKGILYYRPMIVTNRKRWKYIGVLHECLVEIDPMNGSSNIDGNYFVRACTKGKRSDDPDKYKKDALLLKTAYENETNPFLKDRYAFYAAQSYKDSEQQDQAIQWYRIVLSLNNWTQEKYYACLMLGYLHESKQDFETALHYFTKTVEYDPERIEGVVNACRLFYDRGCHLLVHLLYEQYKQVDLNTLDTSKKLFLCEMYYHDELSYYNSISSYYLKNYASGYESCKRNILNQRLCPSRLYNAMDNLYYYREEIKKDKDTVLFFQKVKHMLDAKGFFSEREKLVLSLLECSV